MRIRRAAIINQFVTGENNAHKKAKKNNTNNVNAHNVTFRSFSLVWLYVGISDVFSFMPEYGTCDLQRWKASLSDL